MYPSSTSNSEPTRPVAAVDDTLVAVPGDLAEASPRRRAAAWTVVAFFLGAFAVTGLVDSFHPAARPKLRGAEEAADARLRREAHLLDGSLARLLEHDLRLTSRVRRDLASYYTLILFRHLDEAQGRAVVGREGWIFLRGRTVVQNRGDAAHLGWTTALLAALERRLASLGVRLVVAPVPRKSVLYGEYLPRGVETRPELDERFPRRLATRGVAVVDLLNAFRGVQERSPEDLLYFQTDSHWTETAQLVAAEAIAERAGLPAPGAARRTRLVEGHAEQERDNLDYIGLVDVPASALAFLGLVPVKTYDVVSEGEEPGEGEPPASPRLAVTGTSFTAKRKLVAYLQHFAREPVRNAATVGTHPLESLAALLVEPRESLPETVVLELPSHNVFGHSPLAHAADLFAVTAPEEAVPALTLRRLTRQQKLRREIVLEGRLELGRLPAGTLLHSGDGVVAIRIRGRLDGDAEIVVQHAGHELRTPWPAGQKEVFLPLVAARATGARARLEVQGAGKLRLEAVEAVAFLDESGAALGRHTRLRPRGGGWYQILRFRDAPEVEHHAALVLELAGGRLQDPLEVVLKTAETPDEPLQLTLGPVGEKGIVVLSLSPLRGRHLTAVEARGTGPAPAALIRRGRLLGVSVPPP